MESFHYGQIQDVYLVVHDETPPGDGEWGRYVDDLEECAHKVKGMLVWTMGGGPSAAQRTAIADRWKRLGYQRPVAVCSPSAMVRGMVTALNWVLRNPIRTFPLEQLAQAVAFLELGPENDEPIAAALREASRQLRIPPERLHSSVSSLGRKASLAQRGYNLRSPPEAQLAEMGKLASSRSLNT